jgi:small subunit ribosomal protein S18
MNNGKKDRGGYKDSFDKGDSKMGGGKFRRAKRRVCSFCVDKTVSIDYKELNKIRKFISEKGKILPRRMSGSCAKHQRMLTIAVKRARHIALLPYTTE